MKNEFIDTGNNMRHFIIFLTFLLMANLCADGNEVLKLNKVTDSQLKSFFKENGGEVNFLDFYKRALKAALYAQDDIEASTTSRLGQGLIRFFLNYLYPVRYGKS